MNVARFTYHLARKIDTAVFIELRGEPRREASYSAAEVEHRPPLARIAESPRSTKEALNVARTFGEELRRVPAPELMLPTGENRPFRIESGKLVPIPLL